MFVRNISNGSSVDKFLSAQYVNCAQLVKWRCVFRRTENVWRVRNIFMCVKQTLRYIDRFLPPEITIINSIGGVDNSS